MLHGVAGDEGLGDGRLAALTHVVGAVVVHEQRAQAAGRDVAGEGEILLVARVAAGQTQGCLWQPHLSACPRGSWYRLPRGSSQCGPVAPGTVLSPQPWGAEPRGVGGCRVAAPCSPVLEQQRPQHVGAVLGPDLVGDDHLLHHLVSHPRQSLLVQVEEHST